MSYTTSEVLDLAADKIQAQGWARYTGIDGEGPYPVCMEGALMGALGTQRLADLWHSNAYKALGDYLGLDVSVTRRTFGALLFPQQPLYRWNDFEARDAEHVVEVLRAAAAVQRAYETEDQPLPIEVAA